LVGTLENANEALEQIAFADIVLVNKTDLVGPEELAAALNRIKAINPVAVVHETERCGVALSELLGRDAFNLDRILEVEPDFLAGSHEHEHNDDVSSLSLVGDQPIDPKKFFPWIQNIVQTLGKDVMRMKGVIAFENDPDRFVIQSVHMLLEGDHQRPWKADEARTSRLVFIGRNLPKEALREGFERSFAAEQQSS